LYQRVKSSKTVNLKGVPQNNVKVDSDKDLNVARVYSLTMRTLEQRGVKMEPPFDGVTFGNSYFIRPDKVK
jgi:hypothetical protein